MNTNLTTESETKLRTIVDYWNENRVSDEAEYSEDSVAAALLSLMIDKESARIDRVKTEMIRHYPNMNLKQYEAERAEFIRQGRIRPWD